MDNKKVVVVTDLTRTRLEELKKQFIKKDGERKTLGGVVDSLVKDAYEKLSQ